MVSEAAGLRLDAGSALRRARAAGGRLQASGLVPGSRIGLCAPTATLPPRQAARVQAAVACAAFGALSSGYVPVMINPVLSNEEQATYLADAQVSAILRDDDVLALTNDYGAPPTRTWYDFPLGRPMHFTSGTTGRSKGVWSAAISASDSSAYWQDELRAWPLTAEDTVLTFGPLAHSAPLRFAMLAMLAGAGVVFTGPFQAERTAAAIRTWHPTVAMAVPTHLQRIFDMTSKVPSSTFRMLAHAGSACPSDLKRAIHTWAGADQVWEFLGSTEGQFTLCRGTEWEQRPGTLGRARPGRTLLIDHHDSNEAGVIWCAAPSYAKFAYFEDEQKTAAAWQDTPYGPAFSVGDLGEIDDEGYLYLRGRRSDLIVTGGMNVYPAEVEDEIRRCPGVREVAVYGVADSDWGERVCAAVVADVPAKVVTKWCADHLAGYRRPKSMALVPQLPMTSNGKIRRVGLAEWVAAQR